MMNRIVAAFPTAAEGLGAAIIRVAADDRERAGGVIEALARLPGVAVEIEHLALGDYVADGRILFERKTFADLAASIIDGRLFGQGRRLAASALPAAVIIEGKAADATALGVRREAIQGALITLELFLGVALLRSGAPEETARLICYAARQARAVACGALPRPGYRPKGRRRLQLYILQGLPNVGPRRAADLLARFGSVENVFRAPAEALAATPGIGRHIAKRIRWAVEEPPAPAYSTAAHPARAPGGRADRTDRTNQIRPIRPIRPIPSPTLT